MHVCPADAILPGPALLYLFVVDTHRGEGIARALAEACRERWPGIQADARGPKEWQLLHHLGFDPGRTLDDELRDHMEG